MFRFLPLPLRFYMRTIAFSIAFCQRPYANNVVIMWLHPFHGFLKDSFESCGLKTQITNISKYIKLLPKLV